MADFVWFPVTGNGQSASNPFTWHGGQQSWNTAAYWGQDNLLNLTQPPPAGSVPGSGTGASSGFGKDNVYIVAGSIGTTVFSLYTPDPAKGDPYIASNTYGVDITLSSGTVGIGNLSMAEFNVSPNGNPMYPVVYVQGGATLDITGNISSSVVAVTPTISTLLGPLGGTVTATGGGVLALNTGGVVEVAGGVQQQTYFLFQDGAGERLVLGSATNPALSNFNGTIEGFGGGNTIELQGVPYTGKHAETLGSNGVLTVYGSGVNYIEHIFPVTAGETVVASALPGGAGTELTVACFASGTRIMTARGEVAVEDLREGDLVVTTQGADPVVWLGHRRVDCRRHPRPWDVRPVRVAAGAFAPGVPRRDLLLSPDHAVFVDGALIPVRYLINGATIAQEDAEAVTYWHVELPEHGVLLAEGLPCESFLDTGSRSTFADGGAGRRGEPDVALAVWAARGCAPLVTEGEGLLAARRRLFERALAMGHALEDDPGLHLLADGRVIRPASVRGRRYRFALDGACGTVRLASRAAAPAETRPESGDHRRLGVMVTRLALRQGDARREIPLAVLDGAGWHTAEGEGAWRWTDGDAALPLAAAEPLELEVELGAWARPWRRPAAATSARA